MAGTREAAHIGADLGQDHLRGEVTDARDRRRHLHHLTGRAEVALHLRVDRRNGLPQPVVLAQVHAEQEAMMVADPARQRGMDRLGRHLHSRADQRLQPGRIAHALDHCVEDGAAGLAHDIGEH